MTQWKSKIGVVSGVRIGVRKIRTFPFLPIPFTTPSLMIQWKLGRRSRKQKQKKQPIAKFGIKHCHRFILLLPLATPTMQFSLDRKRRSHKQNQCSASDSVGSIFTRSYRSTLLITTPTTTPSLVKTSLNRLTCDVLRCVVSACWIAILKLNNSSSLNKGNYNREGGLDTPS